MEVRVLGCYGGSDKGHSLTSFLINDHIAVDAGALTDALSQEEQLQITDVIISHIHFDHTCTLPFLVDNQFGNKKEPLRIHATAEVINQLRQHMFNDICWPDFSKIHNGDDAAVKYIEYLPGEPFYVSGLRFEAVSVNHLVPAHGIIVDDDNGSWIYSSDTAETELLWKKINQLDNPKLLFLECSFPNELETLANDSKHLTPAGVGRQLSLINKELAVRIYHCKPSYLDKVAAEIAELDYKDIAMLRQGTTFKI